MVLTTKESEDLAKCAEQLKGQVFWELQNINSGLRIIAEHLRQANIIYKEFDISLKEHAKLLKDLKDKVK